MRAEHRSSRCSSHWGRRPRRRHTVPVLLLHSSPAAQAAQAAPPLPQELFDSDAYGTQVEPAQHPFAQATPPQLHCPVLVLHPWPETQAAQAAPPVPHAPWSCNANGTQIDPLQQPPGQDARHTHCPALRLHWLPRRADRAGHTAAPARRVRLRGVGNARRAVAAAVRAAASQTHCPVLNLHSCPAAQAAQDTPPLPQSVVWAMQFNRCSTRSGRTSNRRHTAPCSSCTPAPTRRPRRPSHCSRRRHSSAMRTECRSSRCSNHSGRWSRRSHTGRCSCCTPARRRRPRRLPRRSRTRSWTPTHTESRSSRCSNRSDMSLRCRTWESRDSKSRFPADQVWRRIWGRRRVGCQHEAHPLHRPPPRRASL